VTCGHLPWSDQRVIALELGVGECDLALDDMVRGPPTGRVRCPATSSRGCTSGWTGMTPRPVPTRPNCAAMSTSCVAPNSSALHLHVRRRHASLLLSILCPRPFRLGEADSGQKPREPPRRPIRPRSGQCVIAAPAYPARQ